MQLRRPTISDEKAILEMFKEFQDSSSKLHGCFNLDHLNYSEWLKQTKDYEMGLDIPETFVPNIEFILWDNQDRAIGFLNLRLMLNKKLLEKSGHIGYSIRPSQRNKGYGKQILALGLQEAYRKNIREVLVTCHESNVASRAIILANGGILEDVRKGMERYWITPK